MATWRSSETVSGGAGGAPAAAGGGGGGGGGGSGSSVALPVTGSMATSACESRTCLVNSISSV